MPLDKKEAIDIMMKSEELSQEDKETFSKLIHDPEFDQFSNMMETAFIHGRVSAISNLIDMFKDKFSKNMDETITYRRLVVSLKTIKAYEEARIEEDDQ